MLLDSVEYRKQGIMPIAGGWLDQVQIWMTAADYAMTQAAIYAKK